MPKAFSLIALLLSLSIARAADWPQFRGPGSQGRGEATDLPLTFSETEHVKWKTPIHDRAWSSPVILDNQIWLTTATKSGKELFVICVDAESGKIVHDIKLFDVPTPQFCIPFNTYASPTPIVEAGRVYVTFGSPGTACLDSRTAKVLWERRDLECNHYRAAGSSPTIFGELLIMHFDGSDVQYIVALDKKTGKTVWKTNRSVDFKDLGPDGKPQTEGDMRKAFSTPVIATFDGKPILLSLASKAFYCYDPATGKELWRTEERGAHSGSATPIWGNGLVYFCTGHARGDLWAVRPGGSGVVTDTHVVWKVKRNVPTRCSPILVDDLIYMVDDGGIVSCVEAKTGTEVWRDRVKGAYSASPLYAAGRIYFFSESGHVTAIAPGRTFKVLAENRLEDGFMASPAVWGKSLIVRSKTALYRIE